MRCAVAVLLTAIPAAAQPPPPPAPTPAVEPSAGPRARIDIGLLAGLGQADFDEADTSPGIRIGASYMVTPMFGVVGGARYFSIRSDQFDDANVDASNWDLDFGARVQVPISPAAMVFGEAFAMYSSIEFSGPGGSIDGSDIGFGARAGGMFSTGGRLALGAAITYSTASVEIDQIGDVDGAWLTLEGFASIGL